MMTILHISDTHSLHKQLLDLPPADIIIHSGDITENGTAEEVWLTSKSPWNYPVSIDDILALSWLTFDINMLLLHYEQTNIL